MPPPYPDIKVPMTAQQVEDALADLAATFPTLCQRTIFDGETTDHKKQSYIKIAHGTGDRPAVLVLGGVHAREWAPPDALVTLARNLLVSYQTGNDISFPAMRVTPLKVDPPDPDDDPQDPDVSAVGYRPWAIKAAEVKKIVDTVDLYLFPLVNPDGRDYDLANLTEPFWRKNRKVVGKDAQNKDIFGVDINRNFDIIWKFEEYFDMPRYSQRYRSPPASTVKTDDTYRGDHANSEYETGNVASLLNTLPIHYFADVHMAGRHILFSWGIEENGNDSTMTYKAANWTALLNGKSVGLRDGFKANDSNRPPPDADHHPPALDYQEYLPDDPPYRIRSRAETIAGKMGDEILRAACGGTVPPASSRAQYHSTYKVGQSAFLYLPKDGPSSGCSDDYACSRQFELPDRRPIFAYTLETGHGEEQGFHCNYADPPGHFRKINREIHAALLALLREAATSPLPKPPPSPPPHSGPCLIATATMGDAGHPDVVFLRSLRDERLRATPRGARLADLLDRVYYSFSPAVARYLDRHPRARTAVRLVVIRPLVVMLRRVLGSGGPATGSDDGGR